MCNKIKFLTISYQSSLFEALKKVEDSKKRFLICVDENNYVHGVLTDGDIRRAFIKGIGLEGKIFKIYSKDFIYLTVLSSFEEVCEKFKSEKIDFLPIVDENMILLNVITKQQFQAMLLENVDFNLDIDFFKYDNYILEHEIYNRPWGFYKSTILTSLAQGKIITVFPNSELSLQEHKKREEHWVFIKGSGKILLGESIFDAYPGKYVYVPKGCKHKIINDSDKDLILTEVQLGEYFGEDDIIRYDDKYGRK